MNKGGECEEHVDTLQPHDHRRKYRPQHSAGAEEQQQPACSLDVSIRFDEVAQMSRTDRVERKREEAVERGRQERSLRPELGGRRQADPR